MTPSVKNEITTGIGALVAGLGNALPYLTPEFFASLGLTPSAVHVAATVCGLLLILYRAPNSAAAIAQFVAEAPGILRAPPASSTTVTVVTTPPAAAPVAPAPVATVPAAAPSTQTGETPK